MFYQYTNSGVRLSNANLILGMSMGFASPFKGNSKPDFRQFNAIYCIFTMVSCIIL